MWQQIHTGDSWTRRVTWEWNLLTVTSRFSLKWLRHWVQLNSASQLYTYSAFTFESTWLHLWTVISCNIHFRPVNWNEIIETNWKGYKRQHNILQVDGWKICCQTTISNVIRLQNCRFLFFDNNFAACYQFVSHFYPFIAAGVDASNKFFRRLSLFPLKCAYSNYLQTGGWVGVKCKQLIIRSLFWFEPHRAQRSEIKDQDIGDKSMVGVA